jgi:class 3 adenylate cyclase
VDGYPRPDDEATAGQVLITQRLHAEVENEIEVEPVGELTLKGFRRPITAFNVIGVREPAANVSALQRP